MLRLSYRGRSNRKTVTMPNWMFGLVAAGSAAVGIAIFLLISTLAILLLPFVLIAGGITAFVLRKRIERLLRAGGFPAGGSDSAGEEPRRRAGRQARPDIEDAEYRVVREPSRKDP